jgi:uncharacterized membrane protein
MNSFSRNHKTRQGERGVTIVFVALAMVAILAMAALSIDVVVLYLAREEAQRSADAAALTAAKVISLSGITGDPGDATSHWVDICGSSGLATLAAQAMAQQNVVGRSAPTSITVTYSAGNGGTSNTDCSQLSASAFDVNPTVTVNVTQGSFPAFFSRIWGNRANSVSATATAEAFNSFSFGDSHRHNHSCATTMREAVDGAQSGPAQSCKLYRHLYRFCRSH